MKILSLVNFCLLLGLFSTTTSAQSGKISGVVTEAETGEPLAGITVYIESIQKGASTDSEGRYVLLSVPAGIYEMRFSFIGFSTQTIEHVEVNTGSTTSINVSMVAEVFQGEELIIRAEKPIVKVDQTSSVSSLSKETIDALPVLEVSDLVKFQPGVVATDGGFSFRGGRTREVAYIVDGIPVQDIYSQSGGNTIDVEVGSVQELQVLTGTFDAEVGGAQSGVVNVTTRDPSQKLETSFQFRTGGYYPGNDNLFLQGNKLDPAQTKDLSVTLSGPIGRNSEKLGFFLNTRYEDREGYLKGRNVFSISDGQKIDAYQFWYRNVYAPDNAQLIALDTARTPSGEKILDSSGAPITFASGDGKVVAMDWRKSLSVNPKLVFRPSTRTKLTYSAIYNNSEGQGYSDSKRYSPDGRAVSNNYSLTNIFSIKQSISNNFVLNLRASYKLSRNKSMAYSDFNDSRYSYFSGSDQTTGFYFGGTELGRSYFEEDQFISSGDFTWQINYLNEVKAGYQFRSNRFNTRDESIGWYLAGDTQKEPVGVVRPNNAGGYEYFDEYLAALQAINLERDILKNLTNETTEFEQTPIEFAAFAQDKLELGSNLVVKAGLRFEYYDTREKYIVNTGTQAALIGETSNLADSKPKTYLSPRVGISYPISTKGAFRIAYGHFTQMPAYSQLYQNPVDINTNQGRLEGTTVGNPDLIPERTIKYELGLQQQVSDFIGIDINLFYKNVRNLLGREVLATSDGILYNRTVNRDYGLIKGGTVALFTNSRGLLNGAGIDLTYQDVQGSSSNPNSVADVLIAGRRGEVGDVVVDRRIIPLNWDQMLTANTYLTIGIPGNWNVGFVQQIASGQPYTPGFIDPDKEFPENYFDNTEKKPLLLTLDITAEKALTVGKTQLMVRLQINNVLNHLNESTVNSISGSANQIVRLPEDQLERSSVLDYVGLFSDAEDNARPTWYSAPRQVLLSLQMKF